MGLVYWLERCAGDARGCPVRGEGGGGSGTWGKMACCCTGRFASLKRWN